MDTTTYEITETATTVKWGQATLMEITIKGERTYLGMKSNLEGHVVQICTRCYGTGRYSFDGQTDTCYECSGYGSHGDITIEHAIKNAKARVNAKIRKAAKASEKQAQKEAAFAENADFFARLATYSGTWMDCLRQAVAEAEGHAGTWTAKRIDFLTAMMDKVDAKAAEKAAALADQPAILEGRRQITGTIVGVKEVDNDYSYYGGTITKITVQDEDGNRLFGTLPNNVYCEIMDAFQEQDEKDWEDFVKGHKITMVVTITRSDRDEHFGFMKRATKAGLVK